MFDKILDYIERQNFLTKEGFIIIHHFTNQLLNKSDSIENKFDQVREKYQFENLKNIELNKGNVEGKEFYFNRIGFWMARYEFELSIGIEGDIDEEFMLIINESDVYIQNTGELNGDEMEVVFNIAFKIYYSWLGFLWQEKKLYECGVPMCIEVNSDIMTYYFNDFLKHYYSEYDKIYPEKRMKGRTYKRDLSLEEIFISTYYFRDSVKEIKLKGMKGNEFISINMIGTKCSLFKGEIGTKGNLIEEKEFDFLHKYKSKHESSIYYIANQFKIAVNSNWEFKL